MQASRAVAVAERPRWRESIRLDNQHHRDFAASGHLPGAVSRWDEVVPGSGLAAGTELTSLLATRVREFVVQPFLAERGKFVRGTRDAALERCERSGWTCGRCAGVVDELVARLPRVIEGRDGFLPAE